VVELTLTVLVIGRAVVVAGVVVPAPVVEPLVGVPLVPQLSASAEGAR
jgi:hypothetical protein